MAKQRRPTARAARKDAARTRKSTSRETVRTSKPPAKKRAKKTLSRKAKSAPLVSKIQQAYAKALRLYEKGLKAIQRKNYEAAATAFRQLVDQFPQERELHERARLYLNVCERERSPKTKPPRKVNDRILAATLALNRRCPEEAVVLLRTSAESHPKDDRLQYLLALAHALQNDAQTAASHLTKAIALNPENRIQAFQEPDFDNIRTAQPFLEALDTGT